MSSSESDESPEEFLLLLSWHEASLRDYILTLVLNWNDAEDIAQETRLRLWKQFKQYDRSKDFGAWARTIAYFIVLAHRKSVQRRRHFSEQFLEQMGREFTLAEAQDDSRREALSRCMEKLTDHQRALLANCYTARTTIKDAALRMGRSVGAVQRSVARIRALLQKCVEGVVSREA